MQTLEERKAKRATPEFKAKQAAYMKARNATPEAKARRAANNATPEGKARQLAHNKAYRATPEARAKQAAYTATPEFKARQAASSKARLATPEGAAKNAAYATKRRAVKLQQQPAWADQDAIDFVYFSAQVIKDAFGGVAPHVDHIVPLQGKYVRGLHVAENLQLLAAKANKQKSNK